MMNYFILRARRFLLSAGIPVFLLLGFSYPAWSQPTVTASDWPASGPLVISEDVFVNIPSGNNNLEGLDPQGGGYMGVKIGSGQYTITQVQGLYPYGGMVLREGEIRISRFGDPSLNFGAASGRLILEAGNINWQTINSTYLTPLSIQGNSSFTIGRHNDDASTNGPTFSNATVGGAEFLLLTDGRAALTAVLGLTNTTFEGGGTRFALNRSGSVALELTLGNWTRQNQATVHFQRITDDADTTVFANPSGLAADGERLAMVTVTGSGVTSFGNIVTSDRIESLGGYTAFPTTGGDTTAHYEASGNTTLTGNTSAFLLRMEATGAGQSLDLDGNTLIIEYNDGDTSAGAILFTGSDAFTLENGTVDTNGQELILHQHNTAGLTVTATLDAGAGGVTKSGAGSLTFNSDQTFGGTMAVNQGTLLLVGGGAVSQADIVLGIQATLDLTGVTGGNYTLSSTQSLRGNGTVDITGGTLTANGEISPGFSSGQLTIDGNLTLGNSASATMEIGRNSLLEAVDWDQLVVTGDLTWGGDLLIESINSYNLATISSFKLFDAANYSGNFDSVVVGATALTFDGSLWSADATGGMTYTFDIDEGVFAVIPEPSTWGLLTVGLMALLLRRRRAPAQG